MNKSFVIVANPDGLAVGDPMEFAGVKVKVLAIDGNRVEVERLSVPPVTVRHYGSNIHSGTRIGKGDLCE